MYKSFRQLTFPQIKRRRTSASRAKAEAESDSDDGPLLAKSKSSGRKPSIVKKPVKMEETALGIESDSDVPLTKKLSAVKTKIEQRAEKEAKAIRKEEKESKATSASAKKKVKAEDTSPRAKKKQTNGVKKEESSDDDVPSSRKKSVTKTSVSKAAKGKGVKSEPSTPAKAAKSKDKGKGKAAKEEKEEDEDEDEQEQDQRWWEKFDEEGNNKEDDTIKWTTFSHNGVVFPPPYQPLPKNAKMLYDGVPVSMEPEAEEIAGFFGAMLHSTLNVENPTFQKNFFDDFKEALKTGGAKDKEGNKVAIKEFVKCDFKPIQTYYMNKKEEEKERTKAMTKAEKAEAKAEKQAADAPYQFCMWNGRKQQVGNFKIEPPGLFRGRGDHPKTGTVKKRVMPEQVTINIGKEATVPPPPEGHRWKEVVHDQTKSYLASWVENVNGQIKYVQLHNSSDIKGMSDFNKFQKARELKVCWNPYRESTANDTQKHIDKIRRDYTKGLKAELMADRQRATAIYLIDKFALRAGNEKGEDEADTVGCCSLKMKHITLKEGNRVAFDFLGKDSIRFFMEVEVDPQVFKNLKIFIKPPKKDDDEIFDRLTTSALNKHLGNYMSGLTAKVFRTYNASYTMSNLLKEMKSTGSIPERVKDYNDANRQVAILCNHKRTVTAGHAGQMEKMSDRIKGLRYQKWRLKQMMLDVDPKIKKKKGAAFFEIDEDITEEWIKEHQEFLVEEMKTKIQKKFDKENEKLKVEGKKEMKPKELDERMEAAKELAAKFKKENKSKKVLAEGKSPSVEKFEKDIAKLDERVETMKLQAEDKENNKEVALGTSKIVCQCPVSSVVVANFG
jgi:DNA topoisomerase-1